MTLASLRLLLMLGMAVPAIMACSLFEDESRDDPAAASTAPRPSQTAVESRPTLEPSPTTEPLEAGDTVAITWRQVTSPPMDSELPHPFKDHVSELDEPAEDLWRIFTVENDSAPRSELETNRWVFGVSWIDAGTALALGYYTMTEGADGLVAGVEKLIPGMPDAGWDVSLTGLPNLWRPESDFVLISGRNGRSSLLLRTDGTLWALAASRVPLRLAGTAPEGGYFELKLDGPPRPLLETFLTTPLSDSAVFAGSALRSAWSPDASRFAFFQQDRVSILDVEGAEAISLNLNVSISATTSIRWSKENRYLLLDDGVIDLEEQRWALEPTGRRVVDSALSPDNSWLAVTLDLVYSEGTPCGEGVLANQTLLIKMSSGSERTLFDCDVLFSSIEWVDAEHFVTYTHTCWGCESKSQPYLVSIVDGSAIPLSDDFSIWARHEVSPDGSQILVAGPELRVYSTAGGLLRRIPIEDGYEVTAVAWKPDGSGFAYVIGPRHFVIL